MYIENFVRDLPETKQRFEGKVSVLLGFVRETIPLTYVRGLPEPGSLFKQYIRGLK